MTRQTATTTKKDDWEAGRDYGGSSTLTLKSFKKKKDQDKTKKKMSEPAG